MTNTTTGVENAAGQLVERIFDSLGRIGTATAHLWDSLSEKGITPQSADLRELRDIVLAEVRAQPDMLNGAGVVVADGVLADRPRHLEWWRGGSKPQQLTFDLNPNSDYFYDYSAMEWFVVPRDRGTRWIAGPYLDFTGVDLYICTFSVPVHGRDGVFLGIAGADVTVASLDAALMPALRSSGRSLALVNSEGRVIVANNADHVAGSRLRAATIATGHPVAGTRWTLVGLP